MGACWVRGDVAALHAGSFVATRQSNATRKASSWGFTLCVCVCVCVCTGGMGFHIG